MPETLPPNTIHLWLAYFDQLMPRYEHFATLLTRDEKDRMNRFISDKVKQRFALARGMLRTVLMRYLGGTDDTIKFAYGERGKPILQNSDLHFNLSHSHNLIALGLIQHRQIGVDVEHIIPLPAMGTMAQDNFSAGEFATLYALPESDRLQAFYRCWTRKEAYIKAVGDGFALPLQDFDVTLKLNDTPKFLRIKNDNPTNWTLLHLDLGQDYIGAVCVKGEKPHLMIHPYSDTVPL